jgi:hypothetical protein
MVCTFTLAPILYPFHSKADETSGVSVENGQNTWSLIRPKIRMRTFSEFMSPGLKDASTSVPEPDGTALMETNLFNIVWADYEIAPDTKVVYWQRFTVNFTPTSASQGLDAVARNPRFALRRVNVFKTPGLDTTYDIYIQPGIATEAKSSDRNMEFGSRTNTSYQFPKSRFSIGAVTELTFSIARNPVTTGANLYGWAMPWVNYELNKTFSTQHYATINLMHGRGTRGLQLDLPKPYVQNGIGAGITKDIWMAAFINNYVTTAPSLKNTWASLWLAMNIL